LSLRKTMLLGFIAILALALSACAPVGPADSGGSGDAATESSDGESAEGGDAEFMIESPECIVALWARSWVILAW